MESLTDKQTLVGIKNEEMRFPPKTERRSVESLKKRAKKPTAPLLFEGLYLSV